MDNKLDQSRKMSFIRTKIEKTSNNKALAQETTKDIQDHMDIREAFNLFDKDGNGYITVLEVRHLLTSLGYNMTEAQLMDMMNKVDADGNGAIDFPEFLELTTKKLHVSSDVELAHETFQVLDQSQKHYISAGDIKHILTILEQHFEDEEIEEMIKEADFDNDGVVNFKDFLKMMNINETESDYIPSGNLLNSEFANHREVEQR